MENKKNDLRKISDSDRLKIKTDAMRLRDDGVLNKEVAEKFNLNPSVISRWYGKHVKNLRQPFEPKKSGRPKGTHKKLTQYQEENIIKMLQNSKDLLDKKLVKKKIGNKYDMQIPESTVGDYLRKWGINSSLIKEFENEFVKKMGIEDFKFLKQEIKKREGLLLWINIMDFQIVDSVRVQSIATRVANNKIVFKIYGKRVQPIDLMYFVNQISLLFTKNLYVIFDIKNMDYKEGESDIQNSEKVTFICAV